MTDSSHLEEVFERLVRNYLPNVTKIERHRHENGPDFLVHHPAGVLIAEAKSSKTASIDSILGLVARGVLRTQRIAKGADQTPFVLVVVPRVGPKTRRAVEHFMSENAPTCGWALTDPTGTTRLAIPPLSIDVEHCEFAPSPNWQRRGAVRLFSDLNRWMFKVLLLADAPPHFWDGPRSVVATPTELHRVAKVSVAKAHQFCEAIEKSGFLVRGRGGLNVVRRKTLMQTWFHNERANRVDSVPVRWIFGQPSGLQEILCRENTSGNFAVCGFEACRILGVQHGSIVRPEVYIDGNPETALSAYDLEPCDERDAHLFLRTPRFPQSVFRARLMRDRLPVVDILQAALDVCDQPARGIEQAEYIVESVLGWEDD